MNYFLNMIFNLKPIRLSLKIGAKNHVMRRPIDMYGPAPAHPSMPYF